MFILGHKPWFGESMCQFLAIWKSMIQVYKYLLSVGCASLAMIPVLPKYEPLWMGHFGINLLKSITALWGKRWRRALRRPKSLSQLQSRWGHPSLLKRLAGNMWVWINTYENTILMGWTSINPSYFDVNYRGTIGFDTLPWGNSLGSISAVGIDQCIVVKSFSKCSTISWAQRPLQVHAKYKEKVDTLWLCQNSYWNWPLIVDFPIKNGDFP